MASFDSVCGVECLTQRTNGRELEVNRDRDETGKKII